MFRPRLSRYGTVPHDYMKIEPLNLAIVVIRVLTPYLWLTQASSPHESCTSMP